MSLYRNFTNHRMSLVLLAPFSLETLLEESSTARAKHVRRTVEFAGKLLRIRRSRKLASYWTQNYFLCSFSDS